jgi:hypothetical protein
VRASGFRCARLTVRECMTIDTQSTELRDLLARLIEEHRALDAEIVSLEDKAATDQLHVKRLKKRKLALKDRITSVEDRLLPDIIA